MIYDTNKTRNNSVKLKDYQYFFDRCLDMFFVTSLEGYFIKVNNAVSKTLEYTEEEIYNNPLLYYVHPDDKEKTNQEFENVLNGKNIVDFENRYITKSGKVKVFTWWGYAYDNFIYAIARDVTIENQQKKRPFRIPGLS